MERIQKPDTAYEDDSKREPVGTPRFTAGSARKARQVVALRPLLWRPINQVWASLGTGAHRTRLLAAIALVALAGGIAGGLLAGFKMIPKRVLMPGLLPRVQRHDHRLKVPNLFRCQRWNKEQHGRGIQRTHSKGLKLNVPLFSYETAAHRVRGRLIVWR